jgi:hypothetical protein
MRGFKLVEKSENYDIVVRTRFDAAISDVKLNIDRNVISCNDIWCPDRGGYQDFLALGSYDYMKIYCNFYEFLIGASVKELDTYHDSKKRYAPEKMMEAYLKQKGIPIKVIPETKVRIHN